MNTVAAPRFASALLLAAAALSTARAVSTSPSASQPWVPGDAPTYAEPVTGALPPLPERALSLGDLIDLALRDNPNTESSWQVAVQAAATQNRALGAFLPDLNANVGFGKQYQKTDGQLTAGPLLVPELQIVNTPSVAVTPAASLSWMLWDFGASKAGFNAARAGLVAANYQHNRTLQGVVRQVQAAYFNFDAARGALAAADASADLASSTLNATMLKRGSGLIGVSAEMQSRQGEVQARMQREQVRESYEQARAALFEIAGLPPSAKVTIAEQPPGTEPAPVVAAVGALVDQTLATRPDIAARYAKLAALEFSLQRAQRGFLPTIAFSASASRLKGGQATLSSSGVDNPTAIQQAQVSRYNTSGYIETASAGISVNADITSLFTYNQVVREKRAEIDAARSELHSAIITAEHDVWLAVDACQSAREQYSEARELLDISQKGFSASQQARASGLQSTLDLLSAQQELAQARYALVGARARLFTSAADLAFATGQTAMGAEPGGG
jgi:outer membrane protein TolC